jgi:predicted O-linked N-acetylglucosamine transferase (SPINDLY family)
LFTRAELGLPAVGFVFASFNANFKILPTTFRSWMRILRRVESSVLFIFADSDTAAVNLREEADRLGVDPARVIFGARLVRADYLARLRTMDLFLDTLPYNAGTTASDALWAGLPVLTCQGESFASRVAASILRASELPELITVDTQQYEDLAVMLAQTPALMAEIREKLANRRLTARLFDTSTFARTLESIFERMYDRYLKRLPPEHLV